MKTRDRNHDFRHRLRNLAGASAAAVALLLVTALSARADLVGHWLSGAPNLTETSGYKAAGTHDGTAIGSNAASLAYSADVPSGFTGQSLDLQAGNVGVMVNNSATTDGAYLNTFDEGLANQCTIAFWAKGFPSPWAPWVSKRGEDGIGWQVRRFSGDSVACFTVRGVDNEDGPGSTISVDEVPAKWHHYAAVWDKANGERILYVDGVFSHVVYNDSSQSMALAPAKHLAFGARQTAGETYDGYFPGLLFDVRIYDQALSESAVGDLVPPSQPANLTASPANGRVNLDWTPAAGADSYAVATTNTATSAVTTNEVYDPTYVKSGLTNGTLYTFKVLARNGWGDSAYTSEVGATPALGTAKDILTFEFTGLGPAKISGASIVKDVPMDTDVTYLSPGYTVSFGSTEDANFPPFETRDFTTPQTYTITAENGSTKTYTVTVNKVAPLNYDFNDGLQGWTQIWPSPGMGATWKDGMLNSGGDSDETRLARSPEFYLNTSGPLSFQLKGGQSPLAAPNVAPSAIPKLAIDGGGFGGLALRDLASDTYVLSQRKITNGDPLLSYSFTVEDLLPFASNGRKYTLDYIDYNKGGWGWTWADNIALPATLAPAANILSFNLYGSAGILGNAITLRVPHGTSLGALAPTFTLSPGATSNKASGSTQNFSSPVSYTITSSDLAVTRTYTVTAEVLPDPALALIGHWIAGPANLTDSSGHTPAGTHDGVAVGPNASALAFNPNDVPRDFSGSSLDLRAGNFAVKINNTATTDAAYVNTFDDPIRDEFTVTFWAKTTFNSDWQLAVAKGGEEPAGWSVRRFGTSNVATFTMRGIDNPDAPGSPIAINQDPPVWHHFAGVWDQSVGIRSLYVDGVLSHDTNNAVGEMMNVATTFNLMLGAQQNDAENYIRYWAGLLYDVRIYSQKLFPSEVQSVMTTPVTVQPVEAKIRSFGLPGIPATITGGNIVWQVPFGTDLSALAPTYTLTLGANASPASGTVRDFRLPQTYTVTGADSTVTAYTVNAVLGSTFPASNLLGGWHNRVWDVTAGAWVDLPPNVSEMPLSINGGAIEPAGPDNGLFVNKNGAIEVTGQIDNHLNTLWLRSPAFTLGGSGDLTVQLAKGFAHTAAPANEAAVPYAAITDGGWMGVILRRDSDGAFLLSKTKTRGASDTWYTMTFTQGELAPYVGVACTLELINSDRGGWGWITMDNVALPGGSESVPGNSFDFWIAAQYPALTDKTAGGDPDGDGMTNMAEYAFGLDPSSGSSVNPIVVPLAKTAGTFTYTRRNPAVTGYAYKIMVSTDLDGWAEDAGATASQSVVGTIGDVQTVSVTLTGAPLSAPKMFVSVKAE